MEKNASTAIGVHIKGGIKNWQIFQQKDGYADLTLWGNYCPPPYAGKLTEGRVVCSITDEATSKALMVPTEAEVVNGCWRATIKQVPAGGPYTLKTWYHCENIEDAYHSAWLIRGDTVQHIGVGDLYLIAGQSNAEGNAKSPVQDEPEIGVQMFRFDGRWDLASHPLFDNTDSMFPLCMDCMPSHSPWLCFAKILKRKLGYPIGLIPVTKGGIPLSFWDRAEDGKFFTQMIDILKMAGVDKVKGVIWYQGCSDTYEGLYQTYCQRFLRMVNDFRGFFSDPALPFLTVQINKRTYEIPGEDFADAGVKWQKIRTEQIKAAKEPGVYLVPAIDLTVGDGIHNNAQSNMVIGERTAFKALQYIYKKPFVSDAPELQKAEQISEKEIVLHFSPVYGSVFTNVIHPKYLMFRVWDSLGRVEIVSYTDKRSSIHLICSRALSTGAVISCDDMNVASLMPYDVYTGLPVVPFGETEIRPQKSV